jgi:ABC-type antimicrobial peptide transport system permease subunit
VPGVLDAAYQGAGVPMGGAVTAELSQDSTRTIPMRFYGAVSPNYLRVHGLPILKGRDFEEGDVAGDGVAILSSVTAEKLYPGQNPVGRMIKLGSASFNRRGYVAPWIQIVGVARTPLSQDVVIGEVAWDPLVWVARPPGAWRQAWFLIRTASRDPKIGAAINRAIASNPDVGGAWVFPYTRARDAEIASRLFLAKVFVGMGGLGLALAALGVFGVLAYAVTQRMREFAVRIALGAQPGTLFRMVLHDGLVMLLAGTGVGAFAALAASYLLNAVLIGVNPTDALSLTVAEAVLLAVGLGAALVPARRAISANPVDILRAV